MTLDILAGTFWVPKEGNSEAEYEDAFHPQNLGERRCRILRFAMADGASEGMLSGPWAQILVRSFCRSSARPTSSSARQIVAKACDLWDMWKAAYLKKREERGMPVQWWEEQGLATGPFATILGVAFLSKYGDRGRWDAVALGDTCLFGVSEDALKVKFPVKRSSEFGSRPVLLTGSRAKNAPYLHRLIDTGGTFVGGDRFYLMTDALSCWFLREVEAGGTPWEDIDEYVLVPQEESSGEPPNHAREEGLASCELEFDEIGLRDFIRFLRKSGKMRNDDVTLTCIRVV